MSSQAITISVPMARTFIVFRKQAPRQVITVHVTSDHDLAAHATSDHDLPAHATSNLNLGTSTNGHSPGHVRLQEKGRAHEQPNPDLDARRVVHPRDTRSRQSPLKDHPRDTWPRQKRRSTAKQAHKASSHSPP